VRETGSWFVAAQESTHRVNLRREVGWRIQEVSGSASARAEGTSSQPRGSARCLVCPRRVIQRNVRVRSPARATFPRQIL